MNKEITFEKAELKAYPLLSKLEIGLRGIANTESYYKGLKGTISEIRYGDDKESENECIVEIIMDFEEHPYASVDETNPELNGTGITDVIMTEEDMGFYFEDRLVALTLEGKIVCPDCYETLHTVTETQYDDITWTFKDGEYHKTNEGSSDGKKCPHCNSVIEMEEEVLGY